MRVLAGTIAIVAMLVVALLATGNRGGPPGGEVERVVPNGPEAAETSSPIAPAPSESKREAGGPRGSEDVATEEVEPPEVVDATAAEIDEASGSTSITVRWLGTGGAERVALAVPGHRTFMRGLRADAAPREKTLAVVDPQRAEAIYEGLEKGPWSIGVRDADGGIRWAAAYLKDATATTVVEFSAGDATVRGTVWGADGAPLTSAIVQVQCPNPPGRAMSSRTATGKDGRYEISGLHGGNGWFTATAADGTELASHRLALPAGEVTTVDVGSPAGSARVTVEVVDVAGEPVELGSVEAHEDGGAQTVHGKLGEDGRVVLELRPARWRLQFWGGNTNHGILGEVDVAGSGEFDARLEVPGARILGQVERGEAAPKSLTTGQQRVALRRGDDPVGRIVATAPVRSDGGFRFDRVEPGTFTLTASPVEAYLPIVVTLAEGETTVRTTIRLRGD